MKTRIGYNFWILSLALVLLLLILAAQLFTIRNIKGLITGNQEAAVIFTINNRLQEIVNTAAILQTRVVRGNPDKKNMETITDSLAAMGYNVSVLEKLNVDTGTRNNFIKLNTLISRQVAISFKVMEATESGDKTLKKLYTDSLAVLNTRDSIYQIAINIEKGLETKLKNTFNSNTEASQKLSTLNKIFALIAIAAILILGTIIINRHRRQVRLIEALEKANDEVKKSAIIKEQFLANMSHELRTPLNAIKGFSRLLQQTDLNEEQHKFSDIIENSSNNLLHLVNDILDISKIESGEMTVDQKEFDLKRMLQTLESMFMNTVKEKQLKFTWQIAADVPQYLHGDPDRLYQILINLVSNAFKFTQKGFVFIDVSKSLEDDKKVELEFRIQDTGIGIPESKLELIFERFQQIGNGQENFQKGTGLGLAIVKNLAELLGGSVNVISEAGKGSIFKVVLPFTKHLITETAIVEFEEAQTGLITFNNTAVLVAEDNPVNQLLITKLLNQYAIRPEIKENGMEVLEALKTQHFDLLLLDIQMPLLDGYKTCMAIRENGNVIPVVAMTAYVMDAEKEKCKAAGMNDYLAKPIDEDELKKILQKYLGEFIQPSQKRDEINTNSFLLQLAGGDMQMAGKILEQVKLEIPVEILKLKKIISQNNIEALPAVCHNLISSISPLGNDSLVMKKIMALQKMVSDNGTESEILNSTAGLIAELERNYNDLTTFKQQ
ncbi:MAG: response regulator [Chitinophagaceae bacterium]|nr:response regulator [Chitinophagaceae bacterium]MBK9485304.1 response regulator [Chitinophagaceae bacterium]